MISRTSRENVRGWLCIGPMLLYFIIFSFLPIAIVIGYGFFTDDLFLGTKFVAFDNYIKIFTDANYYRLFLTTILISIFTIAFSIVIGLVLAKLMTMDIKGKGFFRTLYYMPVVVSFAIVSQIVNVWLSPTSGTLNNLLAVFHISPIVWKDNTFWMFFWLITICVWKGLGATVILFIAGLNGISQDIYEAADVDGASSARKFFQITLPQLRYMLVFILITSIIGAINIFEPVQLITEGGPNGATKVIMYQIYNESILNQNLGMGSALSVVMLILLIVLTGLNMKLGEEKD